MQPNPTQPLTPDEVLKDIAQELERPTPASPPILQGLAETKKRQQDFRDSPVLGGLLLLKQLIFGLNRSTFLQQMELNERILELIDDLYYELLRYQTNLNQRLARLEQTTDNSPSGQPLTIPDDKIMKNPDLPFLSGLHTLYTTPAELLMPERVLLYSLVYGLRPAVCLEIGTFHGGSALIIGAALDDVGAGRLICLDPNPKIATADWEKIAHRAELLRAASPEALSQAAKTAGQPFEFVLIDGDHTYEGALKDIEGILPFLADQAYLLFHDCHYPEVEQAIETALKQHTGSLIDCGVLSVDQTRLEDTEKTGIVEWGGLRLVRFTSAKN